MRDLVVGFGRRIVIDHLSLDVRRGEILGLVGASGGGKSVLMRTIIGLIPRQGGQIEVMGSRRRWRTRRRARALGDPFSAGRAVLLAYRAAERAVSAAREPVALGVSDGRDRDAKLEMVGLGRGWRQAPSELSGGMTKRVALARALALDPAIVFLDEPTSGLDPIAAGDFDALIMTLQKTLGLTVFMVTHDLASLNTVCDRVAALADGKIVAIGPMDDLLHRAPMGEGLLPRQTLADAANQTRLRRRMETRAPFVIVGGFLLVAIVAAFGFVYWLHNSAGSARAPPIRCSSRDLCPGFWSALPCCSTASGSAKSPNWPRYR